MRESPDYRPDWRFQLWQQYALEVSSAPDRRAQVQSIIDLERDPVLRQLMSYHFGGRCLIPEAIQYAHACHATNAQTRIGSAIKSMIIAGRTVEQVADEFATDPKFIWTYAKIFFDVARYRYHRVWLKRLCFPVPNDQRSGLEECETHWLQIAYLHGWPGLSRTLSGRMPDSTGSMKMEAERLIGSLISRSSDFIAELNANGIRPTERDLQMLAIVQHRLREMGVSPGALIYSELPTPTEQQKQDRANTLVKSWSPAVRRFLTGVINQCHDLARAEEAAKKKSPETGGNAPAQSSM